MILLFTHPVSSLRSELEPSDPSSTEIQDCFDLHRTSPVSPINNDVLSFKNHATCKTSSFHQSTIDSLSWARHMSVSRPSTLKSWTSPDNKSFWYRVVQKGRSRRIACVGIDRSGIFGSSDDFAPEGTSTTTHERRSGTSYLLY